MSGSSPDSAWLEKQDGERVAVAGNLSLGRTQGNDVVLLDERVSRRHAIIHAQGESEFWMVDLGSRNGTYLNGRRVHQPVRLCDRDLIRLGPFAFTFRQPGARARTGLREQTTLRTLMEIRPQACWLLVADVQGSTPLAQKMPGEELAMLMGQWFLRCKELVEGAGGTVNKYLGDGFLAFWPASSGPSAILIRFITDLRQLQGQGRPQFRFVLHQGDILVGGVASTGEDSLSGPAVNFVFRMEKLAGALGEGVLLSEAAVRQLAGGFPVETVGRHALPGFDGEFEFFRP